MREVFDICGGDDLELNSTKAYHGATLLGCLMTVMEQIPSVLSNEDKELLQQQCMSALALRSYTKHENITRVIHDETNG